MGILRCYAKMLVSWKTKNMAWRSSSSGQFLHFTNVLSISDNRVCVVECSMALGVVVVSYLFSQFINCFIAFYSYMRRHPLHGACFPHSTNCFE
ncbi:hypothetical protein TNIN_61391 [Trichonephila inaurata madagascariensis]|uniref:Uncharacterized protein n=1 Tax=Trichonephila inaurata madagascariensis TaxID=2747483 RepID=A0A8X6WUN9_9ARAC|nr:hypothetical protein TNIN_61391 [Trichonephila inaurata madagascariensis]